MNPTSNLKLVLCVALIFCFSTTQANVDFRKGSYEDVQKEAGYEGKLVFVSFSAIWCAPCKVMDQYTYGNQQVGDYANANFLAMKLDVDSFDGIELKMKHNVQAMPTVLFFNSKGELIAKHEKALTAVEMLKIMKKHNKSKNRVKLKPEPKKEVETPVAATSMKKVNFQKGTYEDLQKEAGYQGKPLFVSFSAIWCAPCKVMDQYTYANPQVGQYANTNFMAMKLDIDSFDGVELKMKHDVQAMPTVLFFNSKGDLIAKHEKALTAVQMLEVMKELDVPFNRVNVPRPQAETPPEEKKEEPVKEVAETKKKKKVLDKINIFKKKDKKKEEEKKEEVAKNDPPKKEIEVEKPEVETPSKKKEEVVYEPPVKDKPEAKKKDFVPEKIDIKETIHRPTGYTVQFGVFSNVNSAKQECERFKYITSESSYIMEDEINGKIIYRCLSGEFQSPSIAAEYSNRIKAAGMENIIKNQLTLSFRNTKILR